MRKILLTLSLIIVFGLYSQSLLRINHNDSTSQNYSVSRINNLTFSNVEGFQLRISKSDSTYLLYNLDKISNITFTADSTGIETQNFLTKLGISLLGNYPNPFNPVTTINFNISSSGHTKVEIYNQNGQKITTLYDGLLPSGNHSLKWNAHENSSSSGTYFVRVSQNEQFVSSKMLMVK